MSILVFIYEYRVFPLLIVYVLLIFIEDHLLEMDATAVICSCGSFRFPTFKLVGALISSLFLQGNVCPSDHAAEPKVHKGVGNHYHGD